MDKLKHLAPEKAAKIKYVLTDIDGTLTDAGKLTAEAYSSLWMLKDAGYKIVPITGGGAGTAIHAIFAWPVDAIITESGALAYYHENGKVVRYNHPEAEKYLKNARRNSLIQELKDVVPGFKLAADQFARICDIAVDYHEAEPFFDESQIKKVYSIAEKYGANVRQSSIHLNVYFGEYDKLETLQRIFPLVFSEKLGNVLTSCIYIGDAPNDQEMFHYFPLSVGVNNILDYADSLKFKPKYITESRCGEGFAEIAEMLVKVRNDS